MANGTEYATAAINELYAENNIVPAFSANPAQYGNGTDWYGVILRNALVTKSRDITRQEALTSTLTITHSLTLTRTDL